MSRKRDNKKRDRKKKGKRLPRHNAKKTSADPLAHFGVKLPTDAIIVHGIPGMPKMSEQLTAFIEPYAAHASTPEAYKKLLTVGMTAWNIALIPAAERSTFLEPLLKVLGGKGNPDARMFLEIVDDLAHRKETDPRFAQDNRFIVDFVVSERSTGGHLEVLSVVPDAKVP